MVQHRLELSSSHCLWTGPMSCTLPQSSPLPVVPYTSVSHIYIPQEVNYCSQSYFKILLLKAVLFLATITAFMKLCVKVSLGYLPSHHHCLPFLY